MRPEKFKKKIAELLNQVFKEADEFAAKYAPIVRKKIQVASSSKQNEAIAKKEVEIFDENSQEFSDAIRKISPEILELIKDQFKCSPFALVRGAFQEEMQNQQEEHPQIQEETQETFEDGQVADDESD